MPGISAAQTPPRSIAQSPSRPSVHARQRGATVLTPGVGWQASIGLQPQVAAGAPPPAPLEATPMLHAKPMAMLEVAGKLRVRMHEATVGLEGADLTDALVGPEIESTLSRDGTVNPPHREGGILARETGVMELTGKIHYNIVKAESVGVKAAQRSFWTKVFGVGVAAIALGVAVSLSVASAGAVPLAGAAAVAGVVLAVSIADAVCGHMNRRNAKAVSLGQPIPYQGLQMGDSSIGNFVYWLASKTSAGHGACKTLATVVDGFFRVGFMVTGGFLTAGVSVAADSFEKIAPQVMGSVNILALLNNLTSMVRSHIAFSAHIKEVRGGFEQLRVEAGRLPAAQREEMLGLLHSAEQDTMAGIESLRGAIPKFGKSLLGGTAGIAWIASGVLSALMPGSWVGAIRTEVLGGSGVFATPVTGGTGGVGTARLNRDIAPSQDDIRIVDNVAIFLKGKIALAKGGVAEIGYAQMMIGLRGKIEILTARGQTLMEQTRNEQPVGEQASVEYMHYVLTRAIDQLEMPDAEKERLKQEVAYQGDRLNVDVRVEYALAQAQLQRAPVDLPDDPVPSHINNVLGQWADGEKDPAAAHAVTAQIKQAVADGLRRVEVDYAGRPPDLMEDFDIEVVADDPGPPLELHPDDVPGPPQEPPPMQQFMQRSWLTGGFAPLPTPDFPPAPKDS